jgi:hypothetical protein
VQVALSGGNDQKTPRTEFETRPGAITALWFFRLEIDLTAVDLLPQPGCNCPSRSKSASLTISRRGSPIVRHPSSTTARALELGGLSTAAP